MRDLDFVLGVDPGRKGALCLLSTQELPQFYDMPQDASEWRTLYNLLTHRDGAVLRAAVEDVHSLYGMSAKSNFQFGGWVRTIQTIVEMALPSADYSLIQPKIWQKGVGLQFPKRSTLKKRKQLAFEHAKSIDGYIAEACVGPRGGLLDGRVDAFLIAYYVMQKAG